jgi:hypothetical protein
MRDGRICGVEYLHAGDDQARIAEAQELFKTKGVAIGSEGFEVWDGTRFVYRFVIQDTAGGQAAQDGLKGPAGMLERIMHRLGLKFSGLGSQPAHA